MDTKFHLAHRFSRSVKKSKHQVSSQVDTIIKVLALYPERGPPIPGHSKLRKMRINIPKLNLGKSGGYRLIYRQAIVDEIRYISLLEIYFKGDSEDLSRTEYDTILTESTFILENPLDFEWKDTPLIDGSR